MHLLFNTGETKLALKICNLYLFQRLLLVLNTPYAYKQRWSSVTSENKKKHYFTFAYVINLPKNTSINTLCNLLAVILPQAHLIHVSYNFIICPIAIP